MSETIRFPQLLAKPGVPKELDQVITLAAAINSLTQGGVSYTDLAPLKLDVTGTECPYEKLVIEFTGSSGATIGDGTAAQEIGLFGEIATGEKYLIGTLGRSLGAALPQIRIISATVGFAQIIRDVGVYTKLSVGGVAGAINLIEAYELTIKIRPIRRRDYYG